MKRSARIGATLAVLLLIAPAGASAGGGGGGGPCAGFRSGPTVVMRDSCFDGVAHFTAAGTTLLVENQGALPHSFAAVDGRFDTGVLQPGERAEIELQDEGIVRVVCTLHGSREGGGMAGVLLVGNPTVGPVGGETQLAAALEVHQARLLKVVEGQTASVAELDQELESLERTSANLTLVVGLTAALAAAAAIGAWRRPPRALIGAGAERGAARGPGARRAE